MVTAAPEDQWRLLDVQQHDTHIAQLNHQLSSLPEHEQLRELVQRKQITADAVVAARTAVSDLEREVAKAESDVTQVRDRAARNQTKLDAGVGNAKDMQALQHEMESLAQRQSVLEDAELEVMQRLEDANSNLQQAVERDESVVTQLTQTTAARDAKTAKLNDDIATAQRSRGDAAAGIPEDLLAAYEKSRSTHGGVGAARLHRRRCEGCQLELNAADLAAVRSAADNAVVTCEECGRILIRTAESGL